MIGKKLKEYRQNNKLSCMDMADKISEKRRQMGLSTSISTSFMRTYSNWEKDNMPGTVSIVNLKILRDIMGCSYEYLLEDIDTFYPNAISIEDEYSIPDGCFNKLMNINHEMLYSDDDQIRLLREEMIYTLNIIILGMKKYNIFGICDYDTWSKTSFCLSSEKASLLFPLYGDFANEDRILDGEEVKTDSVNVSNVFLYNNIYKLFANRNKFRGEINTTRSGIKTSVNDENYSFGNRLREFRRRNNLSQKEMAEKIEKYRKEHNINSVSIDSILRSYQNWENNKNEEMRISIEDLKTLKEIMNCKYEYLLESRISSCGITDSLEEKIGVLSNRLEDIDLLQLAFIFDIAFDDELFSYFTFLLSDKLDFYYRDNNLSQYSYDMNRNIEDSEFKRCALIYITANKLKEVHEISCANMVNYYNKYHYNDYYKFVYEEEDIYNIANSIINLTAPNTGRDPFWEELEKRLICAIMLYIWENDIEENGKFENVCKMACMDISQLDALFENCEKEDPYSLAVREYKKFKLAAKGTIKDIQLSVAIRLQCFAY